MRRFVIASCLLLCLSPSLMASQVYKWVDSNGTTHFSAQPPQGQTATSINTNVPVSKEPPAAEPAQRESFNDIADPEQAAIDKKVKEEVAAKEAEIKKYCESARNNLAQLQNNPRIRMEVAGEVKRLGEDERQAQIAELSKSIAETCKP
ncbi:DUF4124 domain-containing protein [Pseudomonas sp. 5P_3.1_Bac2]|uniref:DUF4124 domain-containing protein n=1 Tax=Pseudomonas sp. 5P_3.1_Bac2 TaxID=2971617 RepID=UPI0021C810E5|nr:DUF4124 domain-containing protein [Pseudomonas sp. 5P_3.1_Bac2]MCU1718756.1 DUF4124 domain-containing protein [Pseudomonas sp. 5P_3.1_Bac2]